MTFDRDDRVRPFDLLSVQVANEGIRLSECILRLEKSKSLTQEIELLASYALIFRDLKDDLQELGYKYKLEEVNEDDERYGRIIAQQVVAFIDAVCYLEDPYGGFYNREKEILSKYSLKLRLLREDMRKIGYVFDIDKALAELQEEIGFKWVEVTTGEMLEL